MNLNENAPTPIEGAGQNGWQANETINNIKLIQDNEIPRKGQDSFLKDQSNEIDGFCSGIGQYHSVKHASNPQEYLRITSTEIEDMVKNPPCVAKANARWAIFSTLPSRIHQEQRENGQYGAAWLDIDENPNGFESVVKEIRQIIPDTRFLAYLTKSATPENHKCRVIVPLSPLCHGEQYVLLQKILNDRIEKVGITPDRKSEAAGQICYLPNKGEEYRHIIEPGKACEWETVFNDDLVAEHERIKADERALAERREHSRQKAARRAASGNTSPIEVYNGAYQIKDCLLHYGYKQCGRRFLSPLSQSGSPGVTVKNNRWISSHESDREINKNGAGDSFDLFRFYEHNNDQSKALKAAADMLIKPSDQNHKNPSLPSSSSLSSGYPSSSPSSNEEVLHFENELVAHDGESKPKLIPQSLAARKIGSRLVGEYAFCPESGTWYRFTGNHWQKTSERKADTKVTDLIYSGAGEVGFNHFFTKGVFELVKKFPDTRLPETMPGKIPFQNGLLDVRTGELAGLDHRNATTWVLPYDYSAGACCPRFLDWLRTAVDGDSETIQLIRAWINAVLIGRSYLQIFLHFFGPGGTGKSTFGRLMFKMVGEANTTTTNLKQLEQNRFEAANIHGKRLVAIEEADKYGGSVTVLKAMTGQDPLRLERKNQQQQGSFIFEGQTIIMSNERFVTSDKTSGIERRRITVEFSHRITQAERAAWDMEGGEEKLLYPEIPGIIAWALELTDEEVARTFKNIPARIAQSNLEAARENNPLLDWMLCNTIADKDSQTQIGGKREVRTDGEISYAYNDTRLYPNYLTWCLENGRESLSLQRFGSVLIDNAASHGATITRRRQADGTKIHGLRLRQGSEKPWLDEVENEEHASGNEGLMKDNPLKMQNMKEMKDFSELHTKKTAQGKTVEVTI